MKYTLLALLLLPLSALASTERLPYTCDNGSRIEISFAIDSDGRPNATVYQADNVITLPQVPVAAGVLYRANDVRLHTKDDEATFDDAKNHSRHCKRGTMPPLIEKSTPPTTSSFIDISGRVFYFSRNALPADATLNIRVQSTTRAGAGARPRILAEQQINLAGLAIPVAFQTTIDRDLISKKGRVTVSARIESAGKPIYSSDQAYPALSKGQPLPVDIQLKQIASVSAR